MSEDNMNSQEYAADTAAACNQMNPAFAALPTPYGLVGGGMIGQTRQMTEAEHEKAMRDTAAQQAMYILEQARQIRANPALMADVRAHIRKLRDDGATLLDDIGE